MADEGRPREYTTRSSSSNYEQHSTNGEVKKSNKNSPTTPDSVCNDSGIDKSDVMSDSIGSTTSLSASEEVAIVTVVNDQTSLSASGEVASDMVVSNCSQTSLSNSGELVTDMVVSGPTAIQTSTPVCNNPRKSSVRFDIGSHHDSVSSLISDVSTNTSVSLSSRDILNPDEVRVPIMGYEVMEERAKFTVFKIQVQRTEGDSWYVFRRYTDFVRLNDRVRKRFPGIRLSLPPKRWFRDNYDKNFLEDRLLGLQAFVDNCTSNTDICNSKPVREFFCFDDPPGPHDSIEESRAYCESLEDSISTYRSILDDKDKEIELLREQVDLYRSQVAELSNSLKAQTFNESLVNRQKIKEYSAS